MEIDTKTLGTGTLDDDERQAVAASIGTCYLCQQVLYTVNPKVVGRGEQFKLGVTATAICDCGQVYYLKNAGKVWNGQLLEGWEHAL